MLADKLCMYILYYRVIFSKPIFFLYAQDAIYCKQSMQEMMAERLKILEKYTYSFARNLICKKLGSQFAKKSRKTNTGKISYETIYFDKGNPEHHLHIFTCFLYHITRKVLDNV